MSEWYAATTARPDTRVLLWIDSGMGHLAIGRYHDLAMKPSWRLDDGNFIDAKYVLFWRPLPDPPPDHHYDFWETQ